VLDGWRIMGETAVVLAPEPLPAGQPWADRWKRAKELSKERTRRERTRLTE
jgi:hypothetical protein